MIVSKVCVGPIYGPIYKVHSFETTKYWLIAPLSHLYDNYLGIC